MTLEASTTSVRHGWLYVIGAALVVRGLLCATPVCISRDGVHFVSFAKQLADDPVRWMKITTKQPGFSYLLAGTHRLLGGVFGGDTPDSWQRCGQLLALLGGVASCAGIYFLTLRLFDRPTALVAGLLASFWPRGGHLSADVLSDMPHLALYLPALLLAVGAARGPSRGRFALCGLIAGAAYLVRQEAIGLVPAVAIWLVWGARGRSRTQKWAPLFLFLLCFTAVVAPYCWTTGRLLGNKGPQDLIEKLFSAGPAGSGVLLASAVPVWLIPGRMIEEWCRSGRYVFSTLFLLALVLKTVPRAEPRARQLVLAAAVMQLVLVPLRVGVFGQISSRYMIIPAALCLPWAAAAFVSILRSIAGRITDPTPPRRAAVWLSGWIIALTPLVYYVSIPVNAGMQRLREAGAWLGEQAGPDELILAHERLEQLIFYTDRTWPREQKWRRSKETDSIGELRKIIRRHRPAWFVDVEASRRASIDEAGHFAALAGGAIPDLAVAKTLGTEGRRVYIFRVRPRGDGADR